MFPCAAICIEAALPPVSYLMVPGLRTRLPAQSQGAESSTDRQEGRCSISGSDSVLVPGASACLRATAVLPR